MKPPEIEKEEMRLPAHQVVDRHTVRAGVLTVEYIGTTIRFDQRLDPGNVTAVVTGELQQICHTYGATTISLGGSSTSDHWEATLDHDSLVEVTDR